MHIVMVCLMVALGVSVILLGAFAAFTKTSLARRIEQEQARRQPRPH